MKPIDFPVELEERLREWARAFRDRRFRQQSCMSAEGRYRRRSEDFDAEGWGDDEAPPRVPGLPVNLLRAIETNDCIHRVCSLAERWALTYAYVFPHLPRTVILSSMRHRTRQWHTWARFLEAVESGKVKLYSCTHVHAVRIDSSVNF